jgi:hypothetical protein
MTLYRYSVRKISTASLAKFGCVLGGVALAIPGFLLAAITWQLLVILATLLDAWQAVPVDLLGIGAPVEFDFVDLLSLDNLLALLVRLNEQRLAVALLVFLAVVLGGGLLAGLIVLLVGWVYNILAALTGGLEVELRERPESS